MSDASQERARRQAEALRENLSRRKTRARMLGQGASAPCGGGGGSAPDEGVSQKTTPPTDSTDDLL